MAFIFSGRFSVIVATPSSLFSMYAWASVIVLWRPLLISNRGSVCSVRSGSAVGTMSPVGLGRVVVPAENARTGRWGNPLAARKASLVAFCGVHAAAVLSGGGAGKRRLKRASQSPGRRVGGLAVHGVGALHLARAAR